MNETGRTAPPAGPDAGDEERYATALEDAFIAERGTPFLLSARDWLLIRGWRERGIPVDTAIRAVRETFERRRARGQAGKIGSISYCANAVEERWELERRGLVGKGEGTRDVAPEAVGPRLERLVASLAAAAARRPGEIGAEPWAKAVSRTLEKVRALPPDGGFDALEEQLSSFESSLLKKLEKGLDEDAAARLAGRVAEALGEPGGVSEEIRERTRRLLVRREVRRMLELPPLTLFDL